MLRPQPYDLRVPLPWVFEEGVYDRFLPARHGLTNTEVRDLIYLILSFKETITDDDYVSFEDEIKKAHRSAEQGNRRANIARLEFLRALYHKWSNTAHKDEKPVFHPFMSDIVSNTICADLLDYLVRDGRRLALDVRNNPRLQRYLIIREESSFVQPARRDANNFLPSTLRLTINAVNARGLPRRDTVSDLIDLMRERYKFAEVVYYHPKKAAFSSMLAKAIELAPDRLRPRDDEEIYPSPWTSGPSNTTPHVTHLGDDALLSYLSDQVGKEDSAVAGLVRRILYRDEYRLLFTLDYEGAEDAGGPLKFIRDLRGMDHDAGRKRWETDFHELISKSPLKARLQEREPAILIYCPNIRMQAKEVAARVELKAGRVIPLNRQRTENGLAEEIRILNAEYRALWRLYLIAHPSLMVPDVDERLEFQRITTLNALIDRFCDHYSVTEGFRSRGARVGYRPWNERVNRHFADWKSNGPFATILEHAPGEIASSVEGFVHDRRLWQDTDRGRGAAIPVSADEYASGFALAVCLTSASTCPAGRREEWPEPLRVMVPTDWLKRSDILSLETVRRRHIGHLIQFGNSLNILAHHRQQPKTWDDFCERVWSAITNGPR